MIDYDPNLTIARRFAALLDALGISHGEVTATGAGAVVAIGCEVRLDPPVDVVTIPLPPGVGGALAESFHFARLCGQCGHQWESLHCPHDGHQRPCPTCGAVAIALGGECDCEFGCVDAGDGEG